MKKTNFLFKSIAVVILSTAIIGCSDDDDSGSGQLPPIGGYNTSDEVAVNDLVAYWPLNGDGKESKSNTSPDETVGVSYETAIKGQGAKLTNGYLTFPSISALATTSPSMTLSIWAKVNNNGGASGVPTMLFSLAKEGDWIGNFNLMAETGWQPATSDTLTMKGLVSIKKEDGSSNNQDIINKVKATPEEITGGATPFPNKNSGKWTHYVITWDATKAHFKLYANGVKISNVPWESRNKDGNGVDQPLALNFFTPTRVVLGHFGSILSGTPDAWQTPMVGSMDEIRVYKKALTQGEIGALYELELAGR